MRRQGVRERKREERSGGSMWRGSSECETLGRSLARPARRSHRRCTVYPQRECVAAASARDLELGGDRKVVARVPLAREARLVACFEEGRAEGFRFF